MNLIDFTKDENLNALRSKMGADLNLSFESTSAWREIPLDNLLITKGRVVSFDDILTNPEDGTFITEDGQRLLVYIRDQHVYPHIPEHRKHKYHLLKCGAIKSMESQGRGEKYVESRKTDGIFLRNYIYQDWGSKTVKEVWESLDVCKSCLRVMRRHYPDSWDLWLFNRFNLEEFFHDFDTMHPARPVHNDSTAPLNTLPDAWDKISLRLRVAANWICEECERDFSNRQSELHVHHINGDQSVNKLSNLAVLCKSCHSKQPGHQHMR